MYCRIGALCTRIKGADNSWFGFISVASTYILVFAPPVEELEQSMDGARRSTDQTSAMDGNEVVSTKTEDAVHRPDAARPSAPEEHAECGDSRRVGRSSQERAGSVRFKKRQRITNREEAGTEEQSGARENCKVQKVEAVAARRRPIAQGSSPASISEIRCRVSEKRTRFQASVDAHKEPDPELRILIEALDQLDGKQGFTKKYHECLDKEGFSRAWDRFRRIKSKRIWLEHTDAFLIEHWGDMFYTSTGFVWKV